MAHSAKTGENVKFSVRNLAKSVNEIYILVSDFSSHCRDNSGLETQWAFRQNTSEF